MNGSNTTTNKEIINRVMNNSKPIPFGKGYFASRSGSIYRRYSNKLRKLKISINKDGYLQCSLRVNGAGKTFLVHRIIMISFVGPSDLEVNHINFIRIDNRLENLEYVTHQENCSKSYIEGRFHNIKDENRNTKLDIEKVREIRAKREEGFSYRQIGKEYGISHTQAKRICIRENWKNV